MKIKVSISIEDKTLDEVKNRVDEGLFRNTSHFIEYAVKTALKRSKDGSN
jgi:Arc/MetJ-type ribon-helix-helix transcriptional regulator